MAVVVVTLTVTATAQSSRSGGITPVASIRVRSETLNWFGDSPGGAYSFLAGTARLGLERQRPRMGWRVEFAAPVLLGLPDDAIEPAPRGLLGAGANYYKANDNTTNSAHLFLKQAYLRVRSHDLRWQGRGGRFEFMEGGEISPTNPTLAAIKRTRIAQRLIGPVGFSHVGRSFDGVDLQFNRGSTNVTVMAGLPTAGVFTADGWGEVGQVGLGYASVTAPGPWSGGSDRSEFRLFGIYYRDSRSILKVDNRPLTRRQEDLDAISVETLGAHYLRRVPTGAGAVDLLGWGAVQFGEWGRQRHRAFAGTVEVGWQPDVAPGMLPWLRLGYFRSSGDSDPADLTHGTFFQLLPTSRMYSRFPFYNLMNLEDFSASLTLRPGSRTTIRSDLRLLRLSEGSDGWYVGGGAFRKDDFGYAMRPSNQSHRLATLLDMSLDVRVASHWTVVGYGGYAMARRVVETIYPAKPSGGFGYFEVEYRR